MNDKEQLEKLWQVCFGDGEAYIRLFFDQVYQDDYVLTLRKGGRIVSAIYALPYRMKLQGQIIDAAYVCGVSTYPDERNKGLMRQLLNDSCDWMKEKGYAASTLMPADRWLFDYYASFGYENAFLSAKRTFTAGLCTTIPDEDLQTRLFTRDETLQYYDLFAMMEQRRSNVMLHSKNNFHAVIDDLYGDGGIMAGLFHTDGTCHALLFAIKREDGSARVTELVYDTLRSRNKILGDTTRLMQLKRLHWIEPDESSAAEARGMIKRLDDSMDLSGCTNHAGSINLMLE